jgi:integrase
VRLDRRHAGRPYSRAGESEEEIPRNVARNVRTGTPRPCRFEPLTADEARQFLAATRGHRLDTLFELAFHTGLRKGELLGLRWEDLDLADGTASIRRTDVPSALPSALPSKRACPQQQEYLLSWACADHNSRQKPYRTTFTEAATASSQRFLWLPL